MRIGKEVWRRKLLRPRPNVLFQKYQLVQPKKWCIEPQRGATQQSLNKAKSFQKNSDLSQLSKYYYY